MFPKTDRRGGCYAMTASLSLRKYVFLVIKDSKNQKQRQHVHHNDFISYSDCDRTKIPAPAELSSTTCSWLQAEQNTKTPLELELKARHTVVTTSQSCSTTSRSGILDSGNAHTLPATGHGRGVSPKLDSDWFGAMAAGFSQKTQKERI